MLLGNRRRGAGGGGQARFPFGWRFALVPALFLLSVLVVLASMALVSSRKVPPVRIETSVPELSATAETVREPGSKNDRPSLGDGKGDESLQVGRDETRRPAGADSTGSARTSILPSTDTGELSPDASKPAPISNREKPSANELIALAKAQFSKNPAKAEKLLREAIDSEPANYEGRLELGRLLTFKKDYRGAIQQYQKALGINNEIPALHFNLGYIYLKQGKYDRARDSYENCLAGSPSYKDEVLTNLGVIELKAGNKMRAKKLFHEALRFNAGNKLARRHLVKLGVAGLGT